MGNHWICKCGKSNPERISQCPTCGRVSPSSGHSEYHAKEDNGFPAGMHSRSPMLEHIDRLNKQEQPVKSQKQHRPKEISVSRPKLMDPDFISLDGDDDVKKKKSWWPFGGTAKEAKEERSHYEYDSEYIADVPEKEEAPSEDRGSFLSTVISVILILLLVGAALFAIQNYESLTRWLAEPTVPEYLVPFNIPNIDLAGLFPKFSASAAASQNASQPDSTAPSNSSTVTTSVDPPAGDNQPLPVVSNLEAKSVTSKEATILWKSDQPCKSKLTIRTETGEPTNRAITEKYTLDHYEILSALDSGKKYFVEVTCWNENGDVSKPVRNSFETVLVDDIDPPQLVSEPLAIISDWSATITWKTNENAVSKINYGTNTSYGFATSPTDGKSKEQNIFISSLNPDTSYHYQLTCTDAAGNTFTSGDYQFRTGSATDTSPFPGNKAPDFTLKSLDGKDVTLSQFLGKKVVLNFWASWCTPCKLEMPHFNDFWDKYRNSGDVVIIAVAGSQSDESVIRSFASESGIDFIVCVDSTDNTFNRYSVTSVPKTYFIDQNGTIRRLQQSMFTGSGEIEYMYNSY